MYDKKLAATSSFKIGNIFFTTSEPAKAEYFYRKSLDHNPGLANAHFNLGVLLASRKANAEAIMHLEKALSVDPNFEKADHARNIIRDLKK